MERRLTIREAPQKEAEATYKLFLKFCKYFSYVVVAGLLAVARCSFGVDGTGSKSRSQNYTKNINKIC